MKSRGKGEGSFWKSPLDPSGARTSYYEENSLPPGTPIPFLQNFLV